MCSPFFDRTPISRDRDCYGLTEVSKISGGPQRFGLRQRFGAHSSLGVYMYAVQHIGKEENKIISGTREESAVADSDEPKQ